MELREPSALTNVPHPLTSFIGRQREIAEVKRLLETTRLLTLTAAGGCGKTRLALQVATATVHENHFKDGVWWVDLAALSDPALVPQVVAAPFDLSESPGISHHKHPDKLSKVTVQMGQVEIVNPQDWR